MRRCRVSLATVFIALFIVAPIGADQEPARCPSTGPLSEADMIRLIAGQAAERRFGQFVAQCGVGIAVTGEVEERLRAAGATDAMIAMIRNAAQKQAAQKAAESQSQAEAAAAVQQAVEQAAWDVIKDSRDPQVFDSFLKQYPNGQHASPARNRLVELSAASSPKPEPVEAPYATVELLHDHGGYLGTGCKGVLIVGRRNVEFRAESGQDSFSVAVEQIGDAEQHGTERFCFKVSGRKKYCFGWKGHNKYDNVVLRSTHPDIDRVRDAFVRAGIGWRSGSQE